MSAAPADGGPPNAGNPAVDSGGTFSPNSIRAKARSVQFFFFFGSALTLARAISQFNRMGFVDDHQIVALMGAHTVGFAHRAASGFFGPWTTQPFLFSNEYFTLFKLQLSAASDAAAFDGAWPANHLHRVVRSSSSASYSSRRSRATKPAALCSHPP